MELSYLTEPEQRDLLETMESEECTPSLSQSQQLKKLSQSGLLDMDKTLALLQQPKANQKENLRLELNEIRKFSPRTIPQNAFKKQFRNCWHNMKENGGETKMRGKAKKVDVMTMNVMNMKQTVERARAEGINISEYTLRRAMKAQEIPYKAYGKTYMIAWDNFMRWVNCEQ